jgi:hypothetical protein
LISDPPGAAIGCGGDQWECRPREAESNRKTNFKIEDFLWFAARRLIWDDAKKIGDSDDDLTNEDSIRALDLVLA